jgi:hypothetical protein
VNATASLAATLPDRPTREVDRSNLATWLIDSLTPDRKAILLVGPHGIGKSILLAQLADSKPDQCISFFVGPDDWTSSPRSFLREVVRQAARLLGKDDPILSEPDTARLRLQLTDAITDLGRHARVTNRPIYMLIDAVDQIPERDDREETILDLLPARFPRNVYLIASSVAADVPKLRKLDPETRSIPNLSPSETEFLLDDLDLSEDQIRRVFAITSGIPEFVAEFRRQLRVRQKAVDDLLEEGVRAIEELIEHEWVDELAKEPSLEQAIGVVAFAPAPLAPSQLAAACEMTEEALEGLVSRGTLLQIAKGRITFASDAHRRFAQGRLDAARANYVDRIIDLYRKEPLSDEAVDLLPVLLRDRNDFAALASLYTPEFVSEVIRLYRDLPRARALLRTATAASVEAEDLRAVAWFAGASAIVGSLSTRTDHLEPMVDALATVGLFDEARALADKALLPEDRLRLLGMLAERILDAGFDLPTGVLSEIRNLAAQVPLNMAPEAIARVAAPLMGIAPDIAISVVERASRGGDGARSLDQALAMLALIAGKPSVTADLKDRIKNDRLREVARSRGVGVARLSAEEVLAESSGLSTPSALLLLREWCRRNRRDGEGWRVSERGLELLTEARDYTPSLRMLRQLLLPLEAAATEVAQRIVGRAALMLRGLPASPFRELVRLRLWLSVQSARWSQTDAEESLLELFLEIAECPEADVRSYCLAQFLLAARVADPADKRLGLWVDAMNGFLSAFDEIVGSSAEQFDVARRSLHTIALIDRDLAVDLASRLNTQERREQALGDLVSFLAAVAPSVDTDWSLSVLDRVTDELHFAAPALIRLVEVIADRGLDLGPNQIDRIALRVQGLGDPRFRMEGLAWLARLQGPRDIDRGRELLDEALAAGEFVDTPWDRTFSKILVARTVGKVYPEKAREVLRQLESPTGFEDTFDGPLLATILSARVATYAADSPTIGLRDDIAVIPSRSVQADLLGRLGDRHYRLGDSATGEQLVRQALALHTTVVDMRARHRTDMVISPALEQFDPVSFVDLARSRDPDDGDDMLAAALFGIISGAPGDIPFDLHRVNRRLSWDDTEHALRLVDAMRGDSSIALASRILVRTILRQRGAPNLTPRQLIEASARLIAIGSKLPDPINIQHEGYRLVVEVAARRLKHEAEIHQRRAWTDLVERIERIPNVADRCLVLAWVAEDIAETDNALARTLTERAAAVAALIPNLFDRSYRLHEVASGMIAIGMTADAKGVLRRAFESGVAAEDYRRGDELLDRILETADSVDAAFAASLTPIVDDELRRYSLQEEREVIALQHRNRAPDPKAEPSDIADIYSRASHGKLKQLASGFGQVLARRTVLEWLAASAEGDFGDFRWVAQWAFETARRGNWADGTDSIAESLSRIYEFAGLATSITSGHDRIVISAAPEPILGLIRPGDRRGALAKLSNWFRAAESSEVLILDPYFLPTDLDIINEIPVDTSVLIVTSAAARELRPSFDDASSMQELYETEWRRDFEHDPPPTSIVLATTPSGKSPFHDRAVIAGDVGLRLGSSVSGLGLKLAEITDLTPDEVAERRNEVLRIIGTAFPYLDGEPIVVIRFRLLSAPEL